MAKCEVCGATTVPFSDLMPDGYPLENGVCRTCGLGRTDAPKDAASATPTAKWDVRLGGFLGGFSVGKQRAMRLAGPASVAVLPDGGLELSARYDPPGTAILALLATVIGFFAAFAVAKAIGLFVALGFLPWYLIIRAMRRRDVFFNVRNAMAVVVDDKNGRVGFQTEIDDRPRWIAIELRTGFEDFRDRVNTLFRGKITQGDVTRPDVGFAIGLGVFIVILIGLIAWSAATSLH